MASSHGSITAFDSKKEDWVSYTQRLDYYFVANDVTTDRKKRAILLAESGPAVFQLIKSLAEDEGTLAAMSYEDLVKLVKEHTQPKPSVIVERYKFNSRIQSKDESIAAYVAALRHLARHCDYGDSLKDMLRDRIVCGIREEGVRKCLLTKKDLKYEKALEIATGMESAEKGSADMKKVGTGEGNVHYTAGGKPKYKKSPAQPPKPGGQSKCFRCLGVNHSPSECWMKDSKCHQCQKIGHISRACKANPKQGHKKPSKPKNTHFVGGEQEGSDQEEDDEAYALYSIKDEAQAPLQVQVRVNNIPVSMEFDTGATYSLISEATYEEIAAKGGAGPLQKSTKKLKTYTGQAVPLLGTFMAEVQYGEKTRSLSILVVKGDRPNLLGRDWLKAFEVDCGDINQLVVPPELDHILAKHSSVFDGKLGALKGVKVTLPVRPGVPPKFIKARTVPYSMREGVEEALTKLEESGIISPVKHSKWASPIVPVVKQDGSIRICGDFKATVNQAMDVDPYPLPTVEEIYARLAGGKHFTKLDLSQAYLQIPLDEESKEYVTINTPKGLFRYNRLPFGVSAAPAIFQRTLEGILQGCKGVSIYLDDILITGATLEEHLRNLEEVLKRLEAAGLKLNRPKCAFLLPRVEYLGHAIDEKGVHPTQEKVRAIKEAPVPKNVTELRSFLGILNYYGKFMANLSTQLAPLHELLQKKRVWSWGPRQKKAFELAKGALQEDTLLVHYDGSKPLVLACDASPYGLGAVLSHVMENGEERPVAYASRTLTPAEKNYAQLEREGLAIVFGVKRFHNYLYGRSFVIESDHQPLSYLFQESRVVPPMASSRIQRWALTLGAYKYTIRYKAGKDLGNADALSRLPRPVTTSSDCVPGDLVNLVDHLSSTTINAANIKRWTREDPTLSQVQKHLVSGWPTSELGESFKPYKNRKKELSTLDGCVLWGARVVVPPQGRKLVLDELHDSHQGASKMKALARSYIWWPNMDQEIETVVRSCSSCQEHRNSPPVAPLHPWEWPSHPWSRLHLDYAGPFMGHMYLILVDAHSKWLDAMVMGSISAAKTIEKLRRVFATHGIPKKIVTDNGPSFVSEEFKRFTRENGIKHIFSAPYHPSSNGLAERGVQTVKQALRQMKDGDSIEEKLTRFLFTYRITPHSTTGVAPAEMLMGRKLRSKFDLLYPDVPEKVLDKQSAQKKSHDNSVPVRTFSEGDPVFVENFPSHNPKWIAGVVQEVKGPLSYLVQLTGGRCVRRHVDSVRARETIETPPPDSNWPMVSSDDTSEPTMQPMGTETRSTDDRAVANAAMPPVDEPTVVPTNPPGVRTSGRVRVPRTFYEPPM